MKNLAKTKNSGVSFFFKFKISNQIFLSQDFFAMKKNRSQRVEESSAIDI